VIRRGSRVDCPHVDPSSSRWSRRGPAAGRP
jgi:hypothetical protein